MAAGATMSDLTKLCVSCSGWEEIVAVKNNVGRQIPREIRTQFNRVFSTYLALYGLEGVFERMNNRSVAQILAEYDPSIEPKPIASGNVDGYSFELYDSPETNKPED